MRMPPFLVKDVGLHFQPSGARIRWNVNAELTIITSIDRGHTKGIFEKIK